MAILAAIAEVEASENASGSGVEGGSQEVEMIDAGGEGSGTGGVSSEAVVESVRALGSEEREGLKRAVQVAVVQFLVLLEELA